MVVIVHTFDKGVQVCCVEEWAGGRALNVWKCRAYTTACLEGRQNTS